MHKKSFIDHGSNTKIDYHSYQDILIKCQSPNNLSKAAVNANKMAHSGIWEDPDEIEASLEASCFMTSLGWLRRESSLSSSRFFPAVFWRFIKRPPLGSSAKNEIEFSRGIKWLFKWMIKRSKKAKNRWKNWKKFLVNNQSCWRDEKLSKGN